ncbi:MAG: hypothetical protein CL474_00515 [Acidobacteria bacterium]|nr:hypothetical protein [Acidobacteriota bacterium]
MAGMSSNRSRKVVWWRRTKLTLGLMAAGVAMVAWWISPSPGTPANSVVSPTDAPVTSAGFPPMQTSSRDLTSQRGPVMRLPSSNLPPLPRLQFPPPRPMEVIRAVYTFAANHPEVLSYVPCYCGCENFGHGDNHDCFVADRNAEGKVAWEAHGMG